MHTIEICNEIRFDDEALPGDVCPARVRAALRRAGPLGDASVTIDSDGGQVQPALEIFCMLAEHRGRVVAEITRAFSMAGVVAMACDEIGIISGGTFGLHQPRSFLTDADEEAMRQESIELDEVANTLAGIYARRSKLAIGLILGLMWVDQGRGVILDAHTATEWGFADRVIETEPPEAQPPSLRRSWDGRAARAW